MKRNIIVVFLFAVLFFLGGCSLITNEGEKIHVSIVDKYEYTGNAIELEVVFEGEKKYPYEVKLYENNQEITEMILPGSYHAEVSILSMDKTKTYRIVNQAILVEKAKIKEVVFENEMIKFDGEKHTPTILGVPDNAVVTFIPEFVTELGKHKVQAKIELELHETLVLTKTMHIISGEYEEDPVVLLEDTYFFENNEIELQFSYSLEEIIVEFVYYLNDVEVSSIREVGIYRVVAMIEETDTYLAWSKEFTIEVKKRPAYDEIKVHFMELGNYYTGDSIYIQIGDIDILIDAGSRGNSAEAISNYLDDHMEDDILEFVIATHAHQDHIAGFVGTSSIPGVFDSYDIKTLIDFPLTNATTQIYNSYLAKRAETISNGTTHYTALESYKNENGAQRVYYLTDNIQMRILYNYYYENKTSDENDYSVCLLISQGDEHYLFTGDLEHKGEEYLVQYNELPKVKLFKAGHHGSPTSSTNLLLEHIHPEIVVVCACAGSDEYTKNKPTQFPSQAFIDRVSVYTDLVYVTSLFVARYDANGNVISGSRTYTSFNGDIIVYFNGVTTVVLCSNHDLKLKETDWFKENREVPPSWQ